jgi:hypothetical protein
MTDPQTEEEPVLCRRCDESEIEREAEKSMIVNYGDDWVDIPQAVKDYNRLLDVDALCSICQQEERAEWLNDD